MIQKYITMALLSAITFSSQSQTLLWSSDLLENNIDVNVIIVVTMTDVFVIVEQAQSNGAARRGDIFTNPNIPSYQNVKIYNSSITNNSIESMIIGPGGNSGESYTQNGDDGNYSISTIYAANQDDYYVLKLAYGGVGLNTSSGLPNWSTSTSGSLNDEFVSDWNDFKSELNSQNLNPIVTKVIWTQGERDCTNQTWANEYETELTNLITSMNVLWSNSSPTWHLVRIREDINPSNYPYRLVVREAIENVSIALSFAEIIDMDTDCTLPDGVHYDGNCIVTKGLGL